MNLNRASRLKHAIDDLSRPFVIFVLCVFFVMNIAFAASVVSGLHPQEESLASLVEPGDPDDLRKEATTKNTKGTKGDASSPHRL